MGMYGQEDSHTLALSPAPPPYLHRENSSNASH